MWLLLDEELVKLGQVDRLIKGEEVRSRWNGSQRGQSREVEQ